jgi:adenylyltransferase/sulfurtransferase
MGASAAPGPDQRFARQVRFAPLGPAGQARLLDARVLLVGCGALGGSLAQALHRAGVGTLVLVDRDLVDWTNLPRQVLFTEAHARAHTPKVEAACETLSAAGGPTRLEPHAAHVDAGNLPALAEGCALVLDGTDNLATRYLINDWSVEQGVPWIYAGVVGASGVVLPVLPGRGACLRCLFPDPPPAGALDTCETAGVILPAVAAVAALQAGLALRLLATPPADAPRADGALEPALVSIDVWRGEISRIRAAPRPACPCCAGREFPFLRGPRPREPVVLCGRNSVQMPPVDGGLDLDALAARLAGAASDVRRAGKLLAFGAEGLRATVFPDGRAILEGTTDVERARAVWTRWIGA